MKSIRFAVLVPIVFSIGLEAQQPFFRSAVDLVLLNVTVTDRRGRLVTDLVADDFQVFEDGRPQELAFFSPTDVPLSVSLVLDTSASMEEQMPLSKRAAMDFIARLRPGDVAQVVSFDSRVEVIQPFTGNRTMLESAIQRMLAGGATALYNAVYIVVSQLTKLKPQADDEVRRQVIVVLSDGEDTASLVAFEQLLKKVKQSQAVIYPVGLGLETAAKADHSDGEFGLRQLARETGGRLFLPERPTDLVDVYTQIANELTSQYVVGYLSNDAQTGEGFRRVAVRIHRPSLQARTRPGYYAVNR